MPEQADLTAGVTAAMVAASEPRSVLQVIERGRWSRALFTSLTLSLTHFEAYVWPRLRASGCVRVDLLVDKKGFSDSLMERHAKGVGRQYVPVPVAMGTGGVFHPKLTYLWSQSGPQDDVLMVGSGNLTFPGYGGNLEVLDILGPGRHAAAFDEAAEFFESLATSPRVDLADAAGLLDCAERSTKAAALGETLEPARFVHCLDVAGMEQFEAAARRLADAGVQWRECVSLSPYHHPRAGPLIRLPSRLDIHALKVGVPSRPGEPSAFPFPEARQWPDVRLDCVAPVALKAESRTLHAKWLEVRTDDRALVLTGSFNATEESLCSTNNVECGVLRELGQPTDCWVEVPEPAYRPNAFERGVTSSAAVIWATLASPTWIHGRVLGGSKAWTGSANAIVEAGHACLADGVIQLNEALKFDWLLDQPLSETEGSPLQLTLETSSGIARGWVSVERILRLSPERRAIVGVVTQVESGNETAEDLRTLIEYLNSDMAALMAAEPEESEEPEQAPVREHPGLAPDADGAHPRAAAVMTAVQFERAAKNAVDAALAWSPSRKLLGRYGQDRDSWAAIEQVLDALRGPPVSRDGSSRRTGTSQPPAPPDPGSTDVDAENMMSRAASGEIARQLLVRFEQDVQMRVGAIEKEANVGNAAKALRVARHLHILVHTGLRLCAKHLHDHDATEAFARRFLKDVAHRHRQWPQLHLLDEAFAGTAALVALAVCVPGRQTQADLSALNSLLEVYCGPDLDERRVLEHAEDWLGCELGLALLAGRSFSDARAALELALAEPTPRALVSGALEVGAIALQREPYCFWDPKRRELLARALNDTRAAEDPRVRLFDPRVYAHQGCNLDLRTSRDVHGHRVLDRDFAANMARWRIAACPLCRRVLVQLKP